MKEDRYKEEEKCRSLDAWKPLTRLGALVQSGKITSLDEAIRSKYPLREHQIVDALLPELSEEVLDINLVQRMTDSGRRVKFRVCAIVGNKGGYIGIGLGKDALVRNGIIKAVKDAKLHLTYIKRGCGSWECNCDGTHSLPFKVVGKSGSVEITLKPAPKGIGLAAGDIPKRVLVFSGVKDIWTQSKGQTRTTFNQAFATFDGLRKISLVKALSLE